MISRTKNIRQYSSRPVTSTIGFRVVGAGVLIYTSSLVAITQSETLGTLWRQNVFYGEEQLELAHRSLKFLKEFDYVRFINDTRKNVGVGAEKVEKKFDEVKEISIKTRDSVVEKWEIGKEHSAAMAGKIEAGYDTVSEKIMNVVNIINGNKAVPQLETVITVIEKKPEQVKVSEKKQKAADDPVVACPMPAKPVKTDTPTQVEIPVVACPMPVRPTNTEDTSKTSFIEEPVVACPMPKRQTKTDEIKSVAEESVVACPMPKRSVNVVEVVVYKDHALISQLEASQATIKSLLASTSERPAFIAYLNLLSKAGASFSKVLQDNASVDNSSAFKLYQTAVANLPKLIAEDIQTRADLKEKLISEHVLDEQATTRLLKIQEKELSKRFEQVLFQEKEKLQLDNAIQALTDAELLRESFTLETQHALQLQTQFLEQEYEKLLDLEIGAERHGRQDKLDELSLRSLYFEENSIKQSHALRRNQSIVQQHAAIIALKYAINNGKSINAAVRSLRVALRDDSLGLAMCDQLDRHASTEIKTLDTIQNDFQTLKPYLRTAQFMPDDGGPMSYLGSWFYSKLLIGQKGTIDQRMGIVEMLLRRGDLDCAAREMNRFEAVWMRKLMCDWMVGARVKLEVMQAVEMQMGLKSMGVL